MAIPQVEDRTIARYHDGKYIESKSLIVAARILGQRAGKRVGGLPIGFGHNFVRLALLASRRASPKDNRNLHTVLYVRPHSVV